MSTINHKISDRSFGIFLGALFFSFFVLKWYLSNVLLMAPLLLAGTCFIVALTIPWFFLPLNLSLSYFGLFMSEFNNYLILGIVFYLVITPLGFTMRLLGRDPMNCHSKKTGIHSYFVPVQRQVDRHTLQDIF